VGIEGQTEVFLGCKTRFDDGNPEEARGHTKIDLTMLTSSNPLFGDYAPHSHNVFSIIDSFEYKRADGSKTYLDSATADYYVVGWHTNPTKDLFTTIQAKNKQPHEDGLASCFMELKDESAKEALDWLASSDDSRLFCHSSMCRVNSDVAKTPGTLVGHDAGTAFSHKQPIAVGSFPIDAILAYCRLHKSDKSDKGDDDVSKLDHLEKDITKLQALLTANSDDVDSHIAATGLLTTHSFAHLDGGTLWKFKESSNDSKPKLPSTRQQERIDDLNRLEVMLIRRIERHAYFDGNCLLIGGALLVLVSRCKKKINMQLRYSK
jgi:hypothetical protein